MEGHMKKILCAIVGIVILVGAQEQGHRLQKTATVVKKWRDRRSCKKWNDLKYKKTYPCHRAFLMSDH